MNDGFGTYQFLSRHVSNGSNVSSIKTCFVFSRTFNINMCPSTESRFNIFINKRFVYFHKRPLQHHNNDYWINVICDESRRHSIVTVDDSRRRFQRQMRLRRHQQVPVNSLYHICTRGTAPVHLARRHHWRHRRGTVTSGDHVVIDDEDTDGNSTWSNPQQLAWSHLRYRTTFITTLLK